MVRGPLARRAHLECPSQRALYILKGALYGRRIGTKTAVNVNITFKSNKFSLHILENVSKRYLHILNDPSSKTALYFSRALHIPKRALYFYLPTLQPLVSFTGLPWKGFVTHGPIVHDYFAILLSVAVLKCHSVRE